MAVPPAKLTAETVAGYAYEAGFRGDALATIVAIAAAESSFVTNAIGDESLAGQRLPSGQHWGPSIGLLQVRSIQEEAGTGRSRDATRLHDPAFNMRSGWEISRGGTYFTPWSVYKPPSVYRRHLDEARAAAHTVQARGGMPGGSFGQRIGGALAGIGYRLGQVAAGGDGAGGDGSAPVRLGTSGDRSPVAGRLAEQNGWIDRVDGFVVGGRAPHFVPLGLSTTSASVSLDVEQVSQVTLVLADPRSFRTWSAVSVGAEVRWFDLRFEVAEQEWGDHGGIEALTVQLRAAGAQEMRKMDPAGLSRSWSNMSPSEVLEELARAAGMAFYGKGTARRPTITRHGRDDTGAAQAESSWDLAQRLAREEGFWAFETADAFYFAPPSWLIERTTRFSTLLRPPPDPRKTGPTFEPAELMGIPTFRRSIDIDRVGSRPIAEGTLEMYPWRGQRVRPGMTTDFAGFPTFDNMYLVTSVDFDIDSGPVTVKVTEAVDPIPEPPSEGGIGDPSRVDDDVSAAAGSAPGRNGMGITGNPTGPYGYQYDPGGSNSGKDQPGAVALMRYLVAKYPGTRANGIYVNKNVAGTKSPSVHAEGRAGDLMVPVNRGEVGYQVAAFLERCAALLGVQQIIWDNRSWNSKRRAWAPYTHPGGSNPTLRHEDHVHFELCWEAARGLTAGQIAGATAPTRPDVQPPANVH